MAKIPTARQVRRNIKRSNKATLKKMKSQEKLGKDFVNHGQGVLPEKVWRNLPGKQHPGGTQ